MENLLRRILLYLSVAGWARNIMSRWGVARRVALRFVAGETLDEAISATKALNARNLWVSLDYLGESVKRAEDTQEVVETYRSLLNHIHNQHLQASISLKLTHFGLDISEELCQTNLRRVLTDAKNFGIPVTIDMENTPYTDITLKIYRTMRDEYDFDNVGTVIQAYLRRSEADMQALGAEGAHIRLCKGAYLEAPDVAFPDKADVDANYAKIMHQYLQTPGYLCIATHDEKMIQAAENDIKTLKPTRYEFQMLYGIRSARQDALAAAGYPVRVYVPFGAAWYPYFMRRLAERPANVWFFAKGFFSR
ncbi:MAG: proline dehydrogenase family protein [Chloroflexi bacterium]|nr:proline dehydrogenase family protein [Chloroflexota bacterium]MCC6892691.1 proline dehydrogenase family protein [Anaerolineae bacterium]